MSESVGAVRCLNCGTPYMQPFDWTCRRCGGESFRVARIGWIDPTTNVADLPIASQQEIAKSAAPEGEGVSGAGVDDWRSTTISSEIASLRADRDRLERERDEAMAGWHSALRFADDEEVKRLERELEEARRALRAVAALGPEEYPEEGDWGGDTEEAEDYGVACGHWEAAEIARRALAPNPDTHPDGTTESEASDER